MRVWYICRETEVQGPFDDETLAELVATGDVTATTLLAPEGGQAWQPASALRPDLFPTIASGLQLDAGSGDSSQPLELEAGLGGYRDFQRRLAGEISIEEAAEAETAFHRGQRLLWPVLVTVAALSVGLTYLGNGQGGLSAVARYLEQLASSGSMLVAMLLVHVGRVPFAGRLLILFSSIELATEPLFQHPESMEGVPLLLLVLILMVIGVAWLLDFGVAAVAQDNASKTGRQALALFGCIYFGLECWTAMLSPEEPWFVGLGAAGVLLVILIRWQVWAAPLLKRWRPALSRDAEGVLKAAWNRWSWTMLGRGLAVGMASFPFVLFLNSLGLEERLTLPAASEAILTGEPASPTGWFFFPAARFLTPADLAQEEVFGVCRARWAQADLEALDKAVSNAAEDIEDEARVEEVRRQLATERLVSAEAFKQRVEDCPEVKFYWIGSSSVRADREHPEPWSISWVSSADALIKARTTAQIEAEAPDLHFLRWLLITLGVLAFLLLWARGGDSPLARWLGLWLVGIGCLVTLDFQNYILNAFVYSAWRSSLISPIAGPILWLTLLGGVLAVILILMVPIATGMVFLHACWPSAARTGPWWRRWLGAWGRLLAVVVGGIILFTVAVVAAGLVLAPISGPEGEALNFSAIACGLVSIAAVSVWIGYRLRLRNAASSEVPELGWPAITAWLLVFTNLAIAALLASGPTDSPIGWPAVGFWTTVLLALAALWLIVPHNFLNVAGGRDLSYISLVVLLPFLFELSEGLAEWLLSGFPLSSEQGQKVVGIFLVVMLLQPIQQQIERLLKWLAVSRLEKVASSVEHALERIAETEEDNLVRGQVGQLLNNLGIDRHLLYLRGPGGSMHLEIAAEAGAPPALALSESLCRHLGARAGDVIDLERVALGWEHFFVQFELARLQQRTACRYLLPFSLGSSLRGLMLVPSAAFDERLKHREIGAEMGKLGIALPNRRSSSGNQA